MNKTVIELFAGVGGFRIGLNNIKEIDVNGHAVENGNFSFVWANQWEPSTKNQHAYDCYKKRFEKSNGEICNIDISLIDKNTIPDHSLLTGGFPCQDYSVAHSLSKEKGIEGKKGVLWWQIRDILISKKTPFVLLENVDRLIKSPAKQRGRDFGIMLECLNELGYAVEWRVINASDYGFPQRRRRIYIFASKNKTKYYKKISKHNGKEVIVTNGIFAHAFPIYSDIFKLKECTLEQFEDLVDVSNNFSFKFENAGFMCNGKITTAAYQPISVTPITLRNIVVSNPDVKYYLDKSKIEKFKYLRSSKKIPRKDSNGHEYFYSEGAMSPFDSLDLPGRTMLTSEGSTNRSTHIIEDPKTKKLRILTPIECERLNQFPDGWTDSGMPERRRYFMMGNALVCGIVKKIGIYIEKIIEEE